MQSSNDIVGSKSSSSSSSVFLQGCATWWFWVAYNIFIIFPGT